MELVLGTSENLNFLMRPSAPQNFIEFRARESFNNYLLTYLLHGAESFLRS